MVMVTDVLSSSLKILVRKFIWNISSRYHFNTEDPTRHMDSYAISMLCNDQDSAPLVVDTDIDCYLEQQSSLMTRQACKWVKSILNLHITEYFTDAYLSPPANSNKHIKCNTIINYSPPAGVWNDLQYVQGKDLNEHFLGGVLPT
jgi:hypothetical protein